MFSVWALLPFQPFQSAPTFTIRIITVFAQLVALTALLGVVRNEAGLIAVLLSWFFLLLSPYHHFNRLGLADSFAAAFQILAIALTWHWINRPTIIKALIIGLILFLAFGAKINSVIFFPVPFAAWLSLNPSKRVNRVILQWLLLSMLTATLLAIVLTLALSWIGQDFLTIFRVHRGSSSLFYFANFFQNINNSLSVLHSYLGTPFLLYCLLSLFYLFAKRKIYIPLVTLAPMLAIWSVQTQQSRFWITPTTLLIIAGAMTLAELIRKRKTEISLLAILISSTWSIVAIPFLGNSYWNPAQLSLPHPDQYQYLQEESAGLAISDVNAVLNLYQPQLVLGHHQQLPQLALLFIIRFSSPLPSCQLHRRRYSQTHRSHG